MIQKIQGTFQDAIQKLGSYPVLNGIIDSSEFVEKATKKYPNGPEMEEGKDVFDLLTALLVKDFPLFQQATTNAATPEGVLASIEDALATLKFTEEQKKQIAVKLLNLRTTSLWDTLTELLLYKTMAGNVSQDRLAIEYPLGIGKKGSPTKDADIALLGDDLKPIALIDAIAPNMPSSVSSVQETVVDWIERKYNSKFSAYCSSNPSAKVSIFVSVIKSELIYFGFPIKMVDSNHVEPIYSSKLDALPGLLAGFACSFRCVNGKTLVLDHLAKYERGKQP